MSSPAPETLPVRSERAERTRQRILDAAGHCLAANGWAKTTVEAIAAKAGVSKALVYHHFRGKEQILEAVLVYLEPSYETCSARKALLWSESEYRDQLKRLSHAREHCDLLLCTDELSAERVLNAVLEAVQAAGYYSMAD